MYSNSVNFAKDRGKISFGSLFCHYTMIGLVCCLVLATLPFSLIFCIKIVSEYKRMVVFRLGRLLKNSVYGPGIVLILPCVDEHYIVDLRVSSYDIPHQEVLTKDSVTITVGAIIYFRTSDPMATISIVADVHVNTQQLAQTTIRNYLGTKTLTEIMSDHIGIGNEVQESLNAGTSPWGIRIERVELNDIKLPNKLCRALTVEAEVSRQTNAKLLSSKQEINTSIALKNAADVLGKSSCALHISYLQVMKRIASHRNHTIVLPIPIDLIKSVLKKHEYFIHGNN